MKKEYLRYMREVKKEVEKWGLGAFCPSDKFYRKAFLEGTDAATAVFIREVPF